ncbi:MAG: ATP-binding protein [Chloroflexota bacterium]|nr:ATP-binding protein [Chloroflexota bacterium]
MRRPSLLVTFSLVSLVLITAIGVVLGMNMTQYFEQQAITQQRDVVVSLVPPVVGSHINTDILEKGAWGADYRSLELALSNLGNVGLVRVKIWNRKGMVAYSDDPKLVGAHFPLTADLVEALNGEASSSISPLDKAENVAEKGFGQLLEVYAPLRLQSSDTIVGAFEGYYDLSDLHDRQNTTNERLWTGIGSGFLFLYVSLFTLVRNASQRLVRQSSENSLLLADTQRKAARLRMINELASSINSSALDLDRVFATALHGVSQVVKHTTSSITMLDPLTAQPARTFTLPDLANVPDVPDVPDRLARLQSDLRDELALLEGREFYICNDTRQLSSGILAEPAQSGALSLVLVSISLGDRRLGALRILSDQPDNFTEDDTSVLKVVADQLAVAIENTRLIRETAETTALREANRLKDEFVSMISHELRTPLSSIKGYTRTLLAEDATWSEQTKREFLEIVSDESDKLAELVENLLEMSRIEAGRLPIAPEPMLLWRFCKSIVERIGDHYPLIRIDCQLGHDLHMVTADPRRVEQVLVNLLQNAAKYSGADRVTVTGQEVEDAVQITIRDNGIGIAPEHIAHLFDKFYRVDTPQGDNGSGTGLGLAIARALVEAQGGKIWVESRLGEGTAFHFTLPAILVEDDDAPSPADSKSLAVVAS